MVLNVLIRRAVINVYARKGKLVMLTRVDAFCRMELVNHSVIEMKNAPVI